MYVDWTRPQFEIFLSFDKYNASPLKCKHTSQSALVELFFYLTDITSIFFAFHSSDFTSESYNAILLVRSFSKYFIEMLPNEEVIRHLGGSVVKSQSDEDVSGFSGQVLRCTGDDWCITYIYCYRW